MELLELIEYAYENTEHYRKTLDGLGLRTGDIRTAEDLKKLPVLTREELQRDPESFVPGEYTKFPKINRIQLRRSYRPDGVYLKTYWDAEDDERAQAPLWRLREEWYGVDKTMRHAAFHSNIYRGNKIFEPKEEWETDGGRTLSLSNVGLTPDRLRAVWKRLQEFAPQWISLTPSVATLLAQMGLAPLEGVRYLELTGEPLEEGCLALLREAFGAQVGNLYGSQAAGPLALSRGDGALKVLEESALLETSPEGEVFVTGIVNHAMPLLRCETGDRGSLRREPDGLYLTLQNRWDNRFIHLPDGGVRSCNGLAAAVEYTNEFMGCPVSRFWFRQTDVGAFEAVFTLKPAFVGWKRTVEEEFLKNLLEPELREARWNIAFEDHGAEMEHRGVYFKGVK